MSSKLRSKPDYTVITSYLAIGTTPKEPDFARLRREGYTLFINMRLEKPMKPRAGVLWVPAFAAAYFPVNQKRLYAAAVQSKRVIDGGGKVYVFCRGGKHRSVVMAAAILIACGYTAEEAKDKIQSVRTVAQTYRKRIATSIKDFETRWKAG